MKLKLFIRVLKPVFCFTFKFTRNSDKSQISQHKKGKIAIFNKVDSHKPFNNDPLPVFQVMLFTLKKNKGDTSQMPIEVWFMMSGDFFSLSIFLCGY